METWCGNCIWHLTIQTFTYLKSTLEKVVDIILVSLFKNSRELFLLYCWLEHISHLFLVFLLLGLNRYKFVYNTSFFWLSVASRWNFANIDNWISFFFFQKIMLLCFYPLWQGFILSFYYICFSSDIWLFFSCIFVFVFPRDIWFILLGDCVVFTFLALLLGIY